MNRNARWLSVLVCVRFLAADPSWARAQTKHPAEEHGVRSLKGDRATRIEFVNKSGRTVKVYWLDYEGNRKLYRTLKDGETWSTGTYLTHPWVITDENDNARDFHLPREQPRSIEISRHC